jgi:predicted Zn-dependent protease
MNRLEDAAARQKACVDVWAARPPSPKPEAGMCMLNLGHTYSQLGRCDEAASWLARARDEITRTAGAEHVLVAQTWSSLGMCAHTTGDLDTAADAYANAIATAGDVEPPRTRGMIRLYLAQVLSAKGEMARARAVAVEAREILATHTDPAMLAEADAFLATLGDAAAGTGD